jgi:hypothetical protein
MLGLMLTANLQLGKTLTEAHDLAARYQNSRSFQEYVELRMVLLVPAALVCLLLSVACAAAIVIFLADRHPVLALPGLILAPVILVGSLFVQAYVFGSWLERRALAQALGRRGFVRWGVDMGELPPVPWVLAAVFLLAPLAILAAVALPVALVLLVLGVLTPVLYARLDR